MDDGSEVIALVTVAAGMTISGWILGSLRSDGSNRNRLDGRCSLR